MVDLIRTAYGFEADKILGGPNWLEMDHFDITAKLPPRSTPDSQKLMLQSLLADRFQLKIRPESKPLSSYFLIVGKKLQLKEADGTGETGCKPVSSNDGPAEASVTMSGSDGKMTTIAFGAGGTIHYVCRNMTMERFAGGLKGMLGTSLGAAPITDETGLKGMWNFDFRFTMRGLVLLNGATGNEISLFDALEKQAGLKLEARNVPQSVMTVESVNQKPSPNPANLEEVMPTYPMPTEFEVASVKPGNTIGRPNLRVQPGGRFNVIGIPLQLLVTMAFRGYNSRDQIVGIPGWAGSERYDIDARLPSQGPLGPPTDMESLAPPLRALLAERFQMKYHTEERPVNAYSLLAAKPKLKKADPASRSSCKSAMAPAGISSRLIADRLCERYAGPVRGAIAGPGLESARAGCHRR